MSNNSKKDNIVAAVVYAFFLAISLAIWLTVCYDRLSTTVWLWIPFGFSIAYLIFAGAHAYISPLSYVQADDERKLLGWVTVYLTALVLAITVIVLAGVQLSFSVEHVRSNPTLLSFYRFEFLALGSMLVFVFPTYWFSNEKLGWLRGTRHVKTAGYIIAIFFCLAGIVEFANYLWLIS